LRIYALAEFNRFGLAREVVIAEIVDYLKRADAAEEIAAEMATQATDEPDPVSITGQKSEQDYASYLVRRLEEALQTAVAKAGYTRRATRGQGAVLSALWPTAKGIIVREKEAAVTKTILVVDDKASVLTLVRDYLTEEGFRVVTAENGRQALFVARHEKPDLILLDIMMPEMGGYEFIRAYRKEQEDTPIILLTAKLEESDKVLGLELGADDYVTKPFGMRELVARIHAVLRRAGQEAPPAEVLRAG